MEVTLIENQFQPSVESRESRMARAASRNDYGILRITPRRWAVVRRIIHLDRKLVGYGKAERYTNGRVGAKLSDPQYLEEYMEYQVVEGCEKMDREGAFRALYQLQNQPQEGSHEPDRATDSPRR